MRENICNKKGLLTNLFMKTLKLNSLSFLSFFFFSLSGSLICLNCMGYLFESEVYWGNFHGPVTEQGSHTKKWLGTTVVQLYWGPANIF